MFKVVYYLFNKFFFSSYCRFDIYSGRCWDFVVFLVGVFRDNFGKDKVMNLWLLKCLVVKGK